MKTHTRLARLFACSAAPLVGFARAHPLCSAGASYLEFISGKGAGSGWDHDNELAAVARFIRSDKPVIFDVGANNGAWSESLAKRLDRPEARFHLFECAPYCFAEIDRRLPGIPNGVVVKRAVTDIPGPVVLHLPSQGSGLASLHERQDVGVRKHEYEKVIVQSITLDAYSAAAAVDHLDLLKMDIEGHELFALKGAHKLLGRNAVQTIFFEFGSANVNSRTFFRDFWDMLTGYGFKFHRILPGGRVLAINRYTETLEYFRGATNYIADRGSY